MSHRLRWIVPGLMALAALGAPVRVLAQSLDAIVTASAPGQIFRQGESFQIGLSAAPPADAPGALTATVDGIGTVDGFVQKLYPTEFDCPFGGCPSGTRPTRCAPGRQCFVHFLRLDVRTPLGRRDFAITVVDARGRQTRLSTSVDVGPALDDDRDGLPDVWQGIYALSYRPGVGGRTTIPTAMASSTPRSSAAAPTRGPATSATSPRARAAIAPRASSSAT